LRINQVSILLNGVNQNKSGSYQLRESNLSYHTSKMDRKELKKKMLEVCMEMQQKSVMTIKAEMAEAYESAQEYGAPEDWFDSYKSDMLNKRDTLAVQLQKTVDEIKNLERIDPAKEIKKASFGAVVVTDKQKLFIAAGIGKITVEGETYHVISQSVPLFHAMKDLKAGDTFTFRDTQSTILEVF